MHTYLKVTNNQNTESNPNIVIGKQGHLCFNIHPTKRIKWVAVTTIALYCSDNLIWNKQMTYPQ